MKWWNKIFNIGIHSELEAADIRRIQLLNRVIFATILLYLSFIPVVLLIGYPPTVFALLICGLLSAGVYLVVYNQYYESALLLFNALSGIIVCFSDYFFPDIGSDLLSS